MYLGVCGSEPSADEPAEYADGDARAIALYRPFLPLRGTCALTWTRG